MYNPSPLQASLVSQDWKTVGDQLITRDEGTNLEWLDLSVTKNRNFDQVWDLPRSTNEFDGFRIASATEVLQLFSAAGVQWPSALDDGLATTTKAFASAWSIAFPTSAWVPQIDVLGRTNQATAPSPFLSGYYEVSPGLLGNASLVVESKNQRVRKRNQTLAEERLYGKWTVKQFFREVVNFNPVTPIAFGAFATPGEWSGYWMVRVDEVVDVDAVDDNISTVPEPSTFIIWGVLGALCLAGRRYRSRLTS